MSMGVEQQLHPLITHFDVTECCRSMAPSPVGDSFACEKADHQTDEDKQGDFQPLAFPCGPAVVLIPVVVTRQFSSFR